MHIVADLFLTLLRLLGERNCPAACLVVCALGVALTQRADASSDTGQRLVPVMALEEGWRFAPGDGPERAYREFDDRDWQRITMRSVRDQLDDDVGHRYFVPGWMSHGFPEHRGWAWYRIHVDLPEEWRFPLALLAPSYVEDAYQIFWNGVLLAESGNFRGAVPRPTGARPFAVDIPADAGTGRHVLAVRVWMDPGMPREAWSGGIHVAPRIGDRDAIQDMLEHQWLKSFAGYVVDALIGLLYGLLALFALSRRVATAGDWKVPSLLFACACVGLLRTLQALYFWAGWPDLAGYALLRYVVLTPMCWATWLVFAVSDQCHVPSRIAAVTGIVGTGIVAILSASQQTELATLFRPWVAAVWLILAIRIGLPGGGRSPVIAAALILVGIGLFPAEAGWLGIPRIWFPFGVGVSRSQYALLGAVPLLMWVSAQEGFRRDFSSDPKAMTPGRGYGAS